MNFPTKASRTIAHMQGTHRHRWPLLSVVLGLILVGVWSVPTSADPCLQPDNGSGTVNLPPEGCDYLSPDEVHEIIDGLPPGTTIEVDPIHNEFFNITRSPGGSLGGEVESFQSILSVQMTGTGDLAGFSRNIWIPIGCQVHTGPRTLGDPVQDFPTLMNMLQGGISGDPDFAVLNFRAGDAFGLPSPGQTTLTDLGGGIYNVDSFFDITYQIDFTGADGSQLEGLSGSTTGMVRMQAGEDASQPEGACCYPDGTCIELLEADCSELWMGPGTVCVPDPCPQPEGACCFPDGNCLITTEDGCPTSDWREGDICTPNPCPQPPNDCTVPDNGTGTINLPPEGCQYLSPNEVHMIIEGLPPGTTIELDPIHDRFFNPIVEPGGSLDGEIELFESFLAVEMTGTGELEGFSRVLNIPISCEVHTGPRTPGESVQDFPNDMYRLEGGIVGDPDFELLDIVAGTGYGLPSPGNTTLTQLPSGDFNVDSFFDITYRIDFVGAPGSQLDGMAGITEATVRMDSGEFVPPPSGACCYPDGTCLETIEADCPTGDWRIFEACDPNPCPYLLGACCYPDGTCLETTEADCGSTDWRANESCTPNPCPQPPNDCTVPDNGSGTINLPPDGCQYLSPDEVHMIIDGLPPGTTIELDPIHDRFFDPVIQPGGTLGGEIEIFDSFLQLELSGTGDLAGFHRTLEVPIACEVHTGPRNPGESVQDFPNDMYRLDGGIFGDPDFDQLNIRAGTDYGLPSPGQTILTDIGGGLYNVDSFFDITYQIEFVGTPGSVLEGMAGTTTATVRMDAGEYVPPPSGACCFPDGACLETIEADCPTGVWLIFEVCDPNPCPQPTDPCTVPDNGSGTVNLPPDGCQYLSPDEVHMIIDGLPPGTTIELDPIHDRFFNVDAMPGGSLGGEIEIFDSFLELDISGTGDLAGFQRVITVPIACEVHTGPRNPGESVQDFPNDMYRLDGGVFGDPDFDMLNIRAGTDYGLPGPGNTTLTQLPSGDFNVDSFFDITYQIEFVGAPGSVLDGMAGITTAVIRMDTGVPVAAPTGACCFPDGSCVVMTEAECPGNDWYIFEVCDPNPCPPPSDECVVPDNGSGTVTLPPDRVP
ncbi:hypothetical protein ACFL6M_06750 [Candidatus Eisenbacteria bacterium]|uniref:Uncharacterized protein n=1 Tax=Eiseniibacteriota bacterium TaxID=2212470 RepID=A0ABV6YLS0_UNCEI